MENKSDQLHIMGGDGITVIETSASAHTITLKAGVARTTNGTSIDELLKRIEALEEAYMEDNLLGERNE